MGGVTDVLLLYSNWRIYIEAGEWEEGTRSEDTDAWLWYYLRLDNIFLVIDWKWEEGVQKERIWYELWDRDCE